jgi:hypothetical protein
MNPAAEKNRPHAPNSPQFLVAPNHKASDSDRRKKEDMSLKTPP